MVFAPGGGTNYSVAALRKRVRGWIYYVLAAGVPTVLAGIALISDLTASTLTMPMQSEPAASGAGEAVIYADENGVLKASVDGGNYEELGSGAEGALLALNNLSDLDDAGDARTNLGLGTAAVEDASAFDAAGTAAAAVAAHEGAGDPHPGYLTAAEGNAAYQPLDAGLTDVAGLAVTDGNFIVGDGANWVTESGATARASLGLTIGTHVQAYDATLESGSGYARLVGRSGGQELSGGTGDGEQLKLESTSHAGKGGILIGVDAPEYIFIYSQSGLDASTPPTNRVGLFSYNEKIYRKDSSGNNRELKDNFTPVVTTFNATSNDWADPADGSWTMIKIECWGGGGSGGKGRAASAAGGGGGGGYSCTVLAKANLSFPIDFTVGAGGAAQTVADSNGNAGGTTEAIGNDGTVYCRAFGGGPGMGTNTSGVNAGGSGGCDKSPGQVGAALGHNWFGAGVASTSTAPLAAGGTPGSAADAQSGGHGFDVFGGGGGGASSTATNTNGAGGDSVWGGAGGGAGAEDSSPGAGAGGTSRHGGNGGAGGFDANAATGGTQPGGGGGGSETGTSGAGGDGRIRITRW